MRYFSCTVRLLSALVVSFLCLSSVQATQVWLYTDNTTRVLGESFSVEIRADIDPADEIIGFGFDLYSSGSVIELLGFTPGAGFADDPVFLAPLSDTDGIRGASGGDLLWGAPVSGLNVLLGTLILQATAIGNGEIGLGADDLAFFFTEGLIPADPAIFNFLPVVQTLDISVIAQGGTTPEPSPLMLLGIGVFLLGMNVLRGKGLRHTG